MLFSDDLDTSVDVGGSQYWNHGEDSETDNSAQRQHQGASPRESEGAAASMTSSASPSQPRTSQAPLSSYAQLQSRIQFMCGRCGPVDRPLQPYDFTGLDYSIALYAVLPRRVMHLSQLCWLERPASSQLHDNLSLFVEACRGLSGLLPDVPLLSLNVDTLSSMPRNVVHHIAVQRWLASIVDRFGLSPDFDALELRRSMRQSSHVVHSSTPAEEDLMRVQKAAGDVKELTDALRAAKDVAMRHLCDGTLDQKSAYTQILSCLQ